MGNLERHDIHFHNTCIYERDAIYKTTQPGLNFMSVMVLNYLFYDVSFHFLYLLIL